MNRVVLDTNALMIPVQFGVDIFSELHRLGYDEIWIPKPVIDELRNIKKGKERIAARVALSLAKRCEIVSSEGNADDAILRIASDAHASVLTLDTELRKVLRKANIPVIYLRQKSFLSLD